MSTTLVGILGIVMIALLVFALFKNMTIPSIAFIAFPAVLALALYVGGYYNLKQINGLITAGVRSTAPTATLFVFSVLFFSIMTDVGLFDVVIGKLLKYVGNSVIGVTVMTAVIATIGHLDGGGASTFLIVIPAMLPIYKKMHMRTTSLLRIAVLAMGVLNLMPWAGPTMRAATVLGVDAGDLWKTLIPIQIFGLILVFGHAVLTGIQEQRRGAGLNGKLVLEEGEVEIEETAAKKENNEFARPGLFWINLIITVAVIAALVKIKLPSYFPFMIGVVLALFINFGFTSKLHKKIINKHAGPALMMCSTLMGAGVLMGILVYGINDKGAAVVAKPGVEMAINSVVTCITEIIRTGLPDVLGQHLPLVIGILSVPLALAFDTDSYFYGMLPIMIGIGESFGIAPLAVAVAMVVCRNCATFISPMVPATLLGTGLADVDIKDHIKNSFLYVWGVSVLCMVFAIIIGIIPF